MGIQEATKATWVFRLPSHCTPFLLKMNTRPFWATRLPLASEPLPLLFFLFQTPRPFSQNVFWDSTNVFGPRSTYWFWCYGYMEEWSRTKLGSFQVFCRHLSTLSAAPCWTTQSGRKEGTYPRKTTLQPGTKQMDNIQWVSASCWAKATENWNCVVRSHTTPCWCL